MMRDFELHHGECLEILKAFSDNSIDAIVTDPPYGLSFMGKRWDYDVPSVDVWAECLRVLKPGGHLLAFAGTRTQHRMAVRIEDAGFEIRDQIMWVYSSGFPKSMNLDRQKGEVFCGCEQKAERDLRSVRETDVPQTISHGEERGEVLQPSLQEQGASAERREQLPTSEVRGEKPSVERRCDASAPAGKLCSGQVCESAGMGADNGAERRLCNGTSPCHGADDRANTTQARNGASHGPQSSEQRTGKLGATSGQPDAQTVGAWPTCGGCGKPRIPSGLGTALKPAHEPITVARKPLIGTVAENVLTHGTGALNIDGCRVGTDVVKSHHTAMLSHGGQNARPWHDGHQSTTHENTGRWPANLLHDGSEEVLAGFPHTSSGKMKQRIEGGEFNVYGKQYPRDVETIGDSGSAARFFYCAKAAKKDRGEGNNHPTVKPTDLMRYLCRLVTPPCGTVLDPFMGSGSTGKAAIIEGFRFIGIEREAEYVEIAKARISAVNSEKTQIQIGLSI